MSKTIKQIYITIIHLVFLSTMGVASENNLTLVQHFENLGLREDSSVNEVSGEFQKGSHVKLFIPNLPYIAISHAVNGSLIRPSDNKKGWVYDVAESHKSLENNQVWEFKLKKGVKFQDGTEFNADSVLLNMKYFKKKPFIFTKLYLLYDYTEKIDDYTVRFHLKEPYGMFFNDTIWLQFYTKEYLEKVGYNGKATCPNLAEAGRYGLGPYILTQGYIEGDRRSKKAILKANPNYWGKDRAKVETITIYTDLNIEDASKTIAKQEGQLDITPIPFSSSIDIVLSKYAKLTVSPTTNNYSMHFNMLNGNRAIQDDRIRYALNHSIDQEYLLNLSMLGEGILSPTMVSPNFYKIDKAIDTLKDYFSEHKKNSNDSSQNLKAMIQEYQKENGMDLSIPLKISILAQKSYLYILKDLKYFYSKIGVELDIKAVPTEAEVFANLFKTYNNQNQVSWDILVWGNYDWFKHPWASFFVYRPYNAWSTIPKNETLSKYTDELARINVESKEYIPFIAKFIKYVYEHNYMVYLPTPNNLYAVNKEVVYSAGTSSFIYLRDLEVTNHHWSVREDEKYPENRKEPIYVDRKTVEKYNDQ